MIPVTARDVRPVASRSVVYLGRQSFTSSSDGLTPGLTSSSSSYRDQDRTGFSIPSTPVFYPDAMESSPGLHPTSSLNPFQTSPALQRYPSRNSGRDRRDSASSKRHVTQAPWTGKGTLFDVLAEPGQGKTLVTCSVVEMADFARRRQTIMRETSSHNIKGREDGPDENDGLAALAMKEADEAEESGDDENAAGSREPTTGWGLVLDIKLRSLGRPVSLEQTARLRSAVFGEKPKLASYRRVESAAARKTQEVGRDARSINSAIELRRSRFKADRIDVKASLARKTPSQMADIVPPVTPVPGTSFGFSSLGMDSSDPVLSNAQNDAGPSTSVSNHQRYPAALSASSSLKRKSLAIPHDQIPRSRLGPNLKWDRKRRRMEDEEVKDCSRTVLASHVKLEQVESIVADRPSPSIEPAAVRRPLLRAVQQTKRPSLLETIVSSSPARVSKLESRDPEWVRQTTSPGHVNYATGPTREVFGLGGANPMSEPAPRYQIGSLSSNAVAGKSQTRPTMKRTLSEIAERESQRHAMQQGTAPQLVENTFDIGFHADEPMRASLCSSKLILSSTRRDSSRQDGPTSTLGSNPISITLPLSDDSASVKTLELTPRETSATPPETWLETPDLENLFGLHPHAASYYSIHDHQPDPWEIGGASSNLGAQYNVGVPFADEAFSFFDSTYTQNTDYAFDQSPVDFSKLPPSSPPSDAELHHSILLLSSPEDSDIE